MSAASAVTQGIVLQTLLFVKYIHINDMNEHVSGLISTFTHNMKVSGVIEV